MTPLMEKPIAWLIVLCCADTRMWQKLQKTVLLLLCFFLFFFEAHIVPLSLLSSLYRLDKPHTSFHPDIQAHTVSNQIPKRPSDFAKDLPLAKWWTFKLSQCGLRWILHGTTWSDPLRYREGGGGEIMHISHIVVLPRKGGTEEIRQANGVPHPLGRSVGEYFLQIFCIHLTYTQECSELALNLPCVFLDLDCYWEDVSTTCIRQCFLGRISK